MDSPHLIGLRRTLLSPAKINVLLRLKGTREDGYHFLESFVVPISLFDRLHLTLLPGADHEISVTSDSPHVPSGATNIAFRAARLFYLRTGRQFSLRIELEKRIPAGSGLGGGSGDAATTLNFLNDVLGHPLTHQHLLELGLELGADVPVFLAGKAAIVRGIGDIVEPFELPADLPIVLCAPHTALATVDVFAEADRLGWRPSASLTIEDVKSNIAGFAGGRRPLTEWLENDLEEAAARICPEVRRLKSDLLQLGAEGASMTGSGSAVFGVCQDAASAERIASDLRRKGLWACSAKTLGADSSAA